MKNSKIIFTLLTVVVIALVGVNITGANSISNTTPPTTTIIEKAEIQNMYVNIVYNVEKVDEMVTNPGEAFGGQGDSNFTNVVASGDITAGDDLTVGDDATILGDLSTTGAISGKGNASRVTPVDVWATTTLTSADSGKIYILSASGTTIILPAVATATGTRFGFIIGGALDSASSTITSAEGDNIEGSILVAGAVVDCNAADVITLGVDGENIGDFFEIFSDGQYWYPLASGTLTAGRTTCSG